MTLRKIEEVAEIPTKTTAQLHAALPNAVAAKHMELLGIAVEKEDRLHPAEELRVCGEGASSKGAACRIEWQPGGVPGAEATTQAISGLMEVHGRDRGMPRRLGLPVSSIGAGVLASQGLLAALISNLRGGRIREVRTSVLQSALFFIGHHIAMSTSCGAPTQWPIADGEGERPPFRTCDGNRVELEFLTFESWKAFWMRLGVSEAGVAAAWAVFMFRYLTARSRLPVELHSVVSHHALADIRRIAKECGGAACRLRSYVELESGADSPWAFTTGCSFAPSAEPPSTPRTEAGPLSGMRVIEASSRLQGPLAGLLLSMLGAEVIKIEAPGGDLGRTAPPGSLRSAYLAYNRGKQVVEIDYKTPTGKAEVMNLAESADVFLHNWRSGREKKLGLDYPDFAKVNARLIYAHASGWGSLADPPAEIAGDFLVQAHAACGDGLNPAGTEPAPSPVTLVDVTGGLIACEGILAALYWREYKGRAGRVDTALMSAALTLQQPCVGADGRFRRPCWEPWDEPLKTGDGFLAVVPTRPEHIEKIRSISAKANTKAYANALAERTAKEWEAALCAEGLLASAVTTDLSSLPKDVRVSGLLEQVEELAWVPGTPWSFLD